MARQQTGHGLTLLARATVPARVADQKVDGFKVNGFKVDGFKVDGFKVNGQKVAPNLHAGKS